MSYGIAMHATLALILGLFVGQERKPDEKPFDDAEFVKMAASGSMHEVVLGKLAQTEAKNAEVKKFAETMVHDHTKANEELKKCAIEAGLPVQEKLLEAEQKEVDRFKDYKGDNFDQDYIKHMVADHEKAVALFKRASKEAKNEKLKDFASKYLPILQAHHDAAKKIEVK